MELEQLQKIHNFLVEIAKKAGGMITSAKPSTSATGSKKNCKNTSRRFIPFCSKLQFSQSVQILV